VIVYDFHRWSDPIESIIISATDVEAGLPLSISTSWKKEDELPSTASPLLPCKHQQVK
jgi:Co/Zn/Cd efflux system component